jgi:hypothetical protein
MRGRGVSACQALEQRERRKARGGRAVPPWRLEQHHHCAIGAEGQAVLRDRRPQEVAIELLEPPPVVARHRDPRVQVAAGAARLQRTRGLDPGRDGIAAGDARRANPPAARAPAGLGPRRSPARRAPATPRFTTSGGTLDSVPGKPLPETDRRLLGRKDSTCDFLWWRSSGAEGVEPTTS